MVFDTCARACTRFRTCLCIAFHPNMQRQATVMAVSGAKVMSPLRVGARTPTSSLPPHPSFQGWSTCAETEHAPRAVGHVPGAMVVGLGPLPGCAVRPNAGARQHGTRTRRDQPPRSVSLLPRRRLQRGLPEPVCPAPACEPVNPLAVAVMAFVAFVVLAGGWGSGVGRRGGRSVALSVRVSSGTDTTRGGGGLRGDGAARTKGG